MALKRQHETLSMFSMASMTDVIFLLLIFFLVTSTFVVPSAMEVNLPQSGQQAAIKPNVRIYITDNGQIFAQQNSETTQGDLNVISSIEELRGFMRLVKNSDPSLYIALHADEKVPYGKIVDVLNMGSEEEIKVVLATKPSSTGEQNIPTESEDQSTQPAGQQEQTPAQDLTVNGTTTVTTTPGDANRAPNSNPNAPAPKTTVTTE